MAEEKEKAEERAQPAMTEWRSSFISIVSESSVEEDGDYSDKEEGNNATVVVSNKRKVRFSEDPPTVIIMASNRDVRHSDAIRERVERFCRNRAFTNENVVEGLESHSGFFVSGQMNEESFVCLTASYIKLARRLVPAMGRADLDLTPEQDAQNLANSLRELIEVEDRTNVPSGNTVATHPISVDSPLTQSPRRPGSDDAIDAAAQAPREHSNYVEADDDLGINTLTQLRATVPESDDSHAVVDGNTEMAGAEREALVGGAGSGSGVGDVFLADATETSPQTSTGGNAGQSDEPLVPENSDCLVNTGAQGTESGAPEATEILCRNDGAGAAAAGVSNDGTLVLHDGTGAVSVDRAGDGTAPVPDTSTENPTTRPITIEAHEEEVRISTSANSYQQPALVTPESTHSAGRDGDRENSACGCLRWLCTRCVDHRQIPRI